MVVCTCGLSYLGSWGGRITWAQEVEVAVSHTVPLHSSLGNREQDCLKKQKQNYTCTFKIYAKKDPKEGLPTL